MAFNKTLAGLLAGAAVASAAIAPAGAVPAVAPAPTIGSVTAQLDGLARRSEQLAEQYNAATIRLGHARAALRGAERNAATAVRRRDQAQARFRLLVQAQYEQGPEPEIGSLLSSSSPQAYLDQQTYTQLAATRAASIVNDLRDATAQATHARRVEGTLLASARGQVTSLAGARAKVEVRTRELRTLLATLTAAQRRAYLARKAATAAQVQAVATPARSTGRTPGNVLRSTVHAGNAAAQKAVDFALAQVGKPYVFAAAGPNAYDCSGLTMASWAAAGVHLPHLASAQYNYGTHVSYQDLQPGDLVFLYADLGHVEIYIGNGLSVSAPQPGENVKIVREADHRSDFYGATRLT